MADDYRINCRLCSGNGYVIMNKEREKDDIEKEQKGEEQQ